MSPEGTLYVAEAGRAGKSCLSKDTCLGFTGALSRVAPGGRVSTLAGRLVSAGGPDGSFATGVDDVAVGPDGSVYGVMTSAPPEQTKGVPAKFKAQPGPVVKASAGTGIFAGPKLDTIEFRSNPDKTDVNSNPYGIAVAADGTQYVADAGGNTILQVAGGKVSLVGIIPKPAPRTQAVPTQIRIGPDGALYIGILGGDGTPKNGARVYRLVPGQKPTIYAKGLNSITGLAFDRDGSLYVTELSRTTGKQGPKGDGDVVKIAPDGTRKRFGVGELVFPAGAAVADDGTIYVSNFSILPGKTPRKSPFKGAGGQIVKFSQ